MANAGRHCAEDTEKRKQIKTSTKKSNQTLDKTATNLHKKKLLAF